MSRHLELSGAIVPRPDKVLFPAQGLTKADLARYYAAVASTMLPHLAGRPINMQRFPDGITAAGFYEKKMPAHFPDWVRAARVDTGDGGQEQVVVDDERTLVHLAGQACITPHIWLSTVDHLDTPDQLVFDLDPSRDDLAEIRRATRLLGELLDALGLTTFLKTTGSRGYHVHVPLRPRKRFDDVREFAKSVARHLVDADPELFTVEQRKAKRGGRLYVDVMRNGYGQTAVPPYAVRARAGAPVSTPIEWDELSRVTPDQHTMSSVPRRLGQRSDPWRDMLRHGQELGPAQKRL
jgi:bifunctional non-homologous end joining protein LigD